MLLGSVVVDVILGMLFIYLLLSLLCAAVEEYIESKLNSRAKLLRKGVELPAYRDATKLPSYIPSRTFTLALWNMATGGAGGGFSIDLKQIRETLTALLTLIDASAGAAASKAASCGLPTNSARNLILPRVGAACE